jgi:N4-gp56 family major capsid protein
MSAINWANQSGYLTSGYLNKKFQMAAQPLMRFRQFLQFKEAFGKSKGETVNWLKVGNAGTYGGKLTETNTMHETDYSMSWGTLTVYEYGNSIPFTFKVEALSEFDLDRIIRDTLLNDAVKCIDGEIERQFNACLLRYGATSTSAQTVTTNGTATVTNTSVLNTYHTRKMITELKKRNVPGWGGLNGDYSMICSLEAMENMKTAVESIYEYTESGLKKLLAGEVGRYMGVRFVEDSFATRYTYDSTARTATAKTWTKAQSLDGYMFGSPTVREAVVVPEEIRLKEVTDYGRSHGLAWYALLGHKIEWDTSGAADTRIIKWDSKA